MRRASSRREPTIALINVVFLMLVFFMVAGTIAPPLSREVALVRADEMEGRAPPDALVIFADGRMEFRGRQVASAAAYLGGLTEAERQAVRLVPDRDLPAARLVALAAEMRAAGAGAVMIVTERGLR
ncbi:biopolymer transporter ExbD [Roseobacter sp. HKCCA0434]|uniref:ExbD/TolR family protein n=1 Tax=Roseobacter sp. HKCCA0434 TaxID=3079297 RepID=UPI002905D708|nr:biopolymer transporter ExbD [Roseobacter sp. HKCCA0434]